MLIIIIIFILLIIFVLGLSDNLGWNSEAYTLFFAVLLISIIICLPILYMEEISNLESFKTTKETVYQLRNRDNIEFEKATMSKDIIEANRWLAKKKYWEKSFWFGLTIPNEILEIEKINY